MSLLNALKALLAKLKALLEALLDQLDPDSVAIQGSAIQNQILTADESDIDHDNGQPFTYQWLANGQAIAGATANTYTLTQADVGKHITLSVTYRNENNQLVTLTSEQTGAVINVNDAVTGAVTIQLGVGQTPAQYSTATANTAALADLDGLGTFHYQWKANGVNIAGANQVSYQLTQNEVGKQITVVVSYTDGFGTNEAVTSAAIGPIQNVNDPVTGQVIIEGTAAEGQTLTANTSTLADLDGLGTLNYQWKANGVNIDGAIAANYVLTANEVGKTITVAVTYVDGFGTNQGINSAATAPVISSDTLTITDHGVQVRLDADTVFIDNVAINNTIKNVILSDNFADTVIVNDVVNNRYIDLGDGNNDIVNLNNITGVTYLASNNSYTAANGDVTRIDGADFIFLGKAGNTFVIDQGGTYNFAINNSYINSYSLTDPNVIKLIEGTGETNINLAYYYEGSTLPFSSDAQKLNVEMQFNNHGPNIDNIATLDFNNGDYSFNPRLYDFTTITAFIALLTGDGQVGLTLGGQLAITLTEDPLDPITGPVTANVIGLRDEITTVAGALEPREIRPWMIIENKTTEKGIADLTTLDSVIDNNDADPDLNILWLGSGGGANGGGFFFVSELNASLDSITSEHVFYNFKELNLPAGGDDILMVNFIGGTDAVVNLGERADGTDIDTLDFYDPLFNKPGNFNAETGLLSYSATEQMHVYGVEKVQGSNTADTITAAHDGTIIEGRGGDDNLIAAAGNDTFIFAANSGHDQIANYNAVADSFLLNGITIQDVQISGADTVVTFGANDSVTLLGVHLTLNDINLV